jgi:predicted nucleic acid-binding protein
MKRVDDPALIDTNVLVDATNRARPRHGAALRLIRRGRDLVLSAQIVREYVAVASRPVEANGLGMRMPDVLDNVREFRKVVRLLPEEKPVLPAFLALLEEIPCRGSAVHDAFLVATMVAHGVARIVTSNPGHFARFGDRVKVERLKKEGGIR